MNLPFHQKVFVEPISSYSPYSFLVGKEEKEEKPLIKPYFQSPLGVEVDFSLYTSFIEQIVRKVIPSELLFSLKEADSPDHPVFQEISDLLPLVVWEIPDEAPSIISCAVLCPSDFTHGVGRYISDTVSRWLVPGKFLAAPCVHSLNFQFSNNPQNNYFVHQVFLEVADQTEIPIIKSHYQNLTQEIRLNILAVRHARHISAVKKLSSDEKRAMIQENLASVLNRSTRDFDKSLFDQMHNFLLKLSAEEKITQIKEKFAPYLEQRQKIFDRDIYNEIRHFALLFRDKFTAIHDLHHVSRLISFLFLFRKTLEQMLATLPHERHLSLKLLKTKLHYPTGDKTVLGILGGINVLRETEIFEERHIIEACQHCMPGIRKVKDSYVGDRRSHDKIVLFYQEIEKEDGTPFTLPEIKEIQKKLPREIKARIENVIHPVFMPRNEEEVMRNIVILSRQLKYTKDLPQVVISFEKQTGKDLSFTVIMLRLLKPDTVSVKEAFRQTQSPLFVHNLEVKEVGLLRKKYPKEANVFTARLAKTPFLRKDNTLDVIKARQAVANELFRVLGEMRDFNGGILSKQHEVFTELRESLELKDQSSDFLLENYFYSLTPPLMQSILPPSLLKILFLMLQDASSGNWQKNSHILRTHQEKEHFLLLASSMRPSFREKIFAKVNELKICSSDLAYTTVRISGSIYLGYIFRCTSEEKRSLFLKAIQDALELP